MTKRVPEIRFEGFTDEWEQRKFEEMLDKNDGVRRGPFGSALKKEIFVKNSDYVVYEQQNAIYDNYKTRYNITKEKFDELHKFSLKENDFIMSGAGTIGRISRVPKGIKKGVFNQALIRFRINNELTNPEYFLQFVRAENMQRKLTGANPGSAISNLVPMSEVKKWEVFVPIKAEQKKLGSFFEQLDDTIALHQRKLEQLQSIKDGFLEKLFPKDRENEPEIRFLGFADDWEQRKLNELAHFSKGSGYTKNDLTESGSPIILYGRLYTKYQTVIDNVDTFVDIKDKSVISVGGEVIVPSSGESSEDIARGSVVDTAGIILGGDLNIIKPKGEIDPTFLALTISNGQQQRELSKRAQGKSIVHLHNSDLKEVNLVFPNMDEQKQISDFLKTLENTITLHQRELELLKQSKKAFLQKMFV